MIAAPNIPPLLRRTIFRLWHILQSRTLFIALTAFLVLLGLLTLVIPQQPTAVNTPGTFVVWVSDLPPFFRRQYDIFNRSGLFTIFRSYWFWLPAGAVIWMALAALGDLIPATLPRLKREPPETCPDHPMASAHRHTARLAAPKDSGTATATAPILDNLAQTLRTCGFSVTATETTLRGVRGHLGWLRPVFLFGGIVLLVFGIALQTIWGGTVQTILTEKTGTVPFIGHTFEQATFAPNPTHGNGTLTFQLDGETSQAWPVNRWQKLNGWWIAPPKPQPLAKITFSNGETTEHTTLIFTDISKPLEFSYAPNRESLLIEYAPDNAPTNYRIRLRDANGAVTETAQENGTHFNFPNAGIDGEIILQNRVLLRATRIPGLIVLVLGLILLLAAVILRLFTAPAIIHIEAVVKGRGSRIEGALEVLGTSAYAEKLSATIFANFGQAEENNAK